MDEEKVIASRILNLLTGKNADEQRSVHLNVIKYFLLKNTNVKEIVGKVNKNLHVAATRDKGFELLSELLEFLPAEVVSENAVSWVKIALGQRPKGDVQPLRLCVIGEIHIYP